MNTNTVYRLFLEKLGGTVPSQFVGDEGELFFNPNIPALKLSDGVTPGGLSVGFGSSEIPQEFVFVNSKSDFPTPSSGVITLENNYTYFICSIVDLLGDRLVAGDNTTILGGSSENCRIKSTGISSSTALLSSVYSLPIRNVTLEAPWAINLVASNPSVHALDWFGVNFTNCEKVGIISSYNNFIMLDGAFLNSQDLTFDGTMGTVGFNQCLFTGNFGLGGTKSILNFPNTFTCTRRIRVTVCSFIVPPGYTGITVQNGVTFSQPESFILQTCNFSGPGTKLGVSTHTDLNLNDSFYEGNRGIQNTFVIGQYYMKDNAGITTFAASNTWTKIVGVTTTLGVTNSKFTPTDNRLTSNAIIDRKYSIQATISFEAGANPFTGKFGIYDSAVGIKTASTFSHLVNNDISHVSINDIVEMNSGDYIEIHALNMDNDEGLRVIDMNVIVSQLG